MLNKYAIALHLHLWQLFDPKIIAHFGNSVALYHQWYKLNNFNLQKQPSQKFPFAYAHLHCYLVTNVNKHLLTNIFGSILVKMYSVHYFSK